MFLFPLSPIRKNNRNLKLHNLPRISPDMARGHIISGRVALAPGSHTPNTSSFFLIILATVRH